MRLTVPKNSATVFWTKHAIAKMRYYGLSAQRILRVLKYPFRTEVGIAADTVAVMQPASIKKNTSSRNRPAWTSEIWVMYKKPLQRQPQKRIISAWRYPGVSPKNDPIPAEIISELNGTRQH